MKRFSIAAVAVIMVLAISVGMSWAYESEKTKGDLKITLTVGSYPLVKSDNDLSVKITDKAGKAVTDAKVKVRFYMPPMPGMAPMSSNPAVELKGNVYRFKANPSMEGTWKTEVKVTRPGAKSVTTTFNLDAR